MIFGRANAYAVRQTARFRGQNGKSFLNYEVRATILTTACRGPGMARDTRAPQHSGPVGGGYKAGGRGVTLRR